MTIKLYAESGSRGFKANQIKIPIEKKLASLEKQGQQEVKNLDTVAKADLNRHKIYIGDKLRADKVQIDNIRDNHLFYENNREWIEKWEQKELDDRVAVARQEYQAAQVSQQRQPDQSLLQKLGPALAKAIPMVVGAVQQQQAIQAEADTAAAKDLMFKLDWTPSQLADYRNQLAALGDDTAKQEAFYESLIGTYSTKTGHVFDRSDFVRLLENSTGAYSISANKIAALNGVSEYEQRMKVWALENRHNFHDHTAFQQALDKRKIEVLHEVFGKDAWNDDIPHAVKFGEIAPELRKVDDAITAAQFRHLNNVSADIDQKRLIGDVQVAAARNEGLGKLYDYRVQRFGGNHSAATYDFFKDIDHLAKNGQIGLEDLDALLRHARETTGNHNLGIGDNQNGFTARIEQARYLVLNSGQQNANILKRQRDAKFKDTLNRTAQILRQEPGAVKQIRKEWMNSVEYPSATIGELSAMEKLLKSFEPGAPVADTRSIDKQLEMIGAKKRAEAQAKLIVATKFKEQADVNLKDVKAANGELPGLGLVEDRMFDLIISNIPKALEENPGWRAASGKGRQDKMSYIIGRATELATEQAEKEGIFNIVKDPKDPSNWHFTAFPGTTKSHGLSDAQWNTKIQNKRDETDKIDLTRSTEDQALLYRFAAKVNKMPNINELTYQEVRSHAASLHYIREGARVLGIPVTQFFADQVKAIHGITLPNSAITTTEEAQQAGNQFKSLLNGYNQPTITSQKVANGSYFTLSEGVNRKVSVIADIGGSTPNYDNRSFTYTPEHRAFLDMIAFAEGTYDQPNSGYSTKVGFGQFDHMAGHDRVIPKGQISDASGRYQFLSTTWNNVGGGAMTPEAQDWGAMRLALSRLGYEQTTQGVKQLMNRIKTEGLSESIIDALAPEWASMPNLFGPDNQGRVGTRSSFYGQGGKSYETLVNFFNKVLKRYSTTQGKVV
tara:strand:- start:189 stop:3047 length:2859 start_codon:yes stop_codon:yes gene_type:complete